MRNERKYWLDDSGNVNKVFWGLCWLCALLILPDLFYPRYTYFSWEGWIGFYGLYGFIACVGLVLLAKQMRKIVKRMEDYYDR